MDYFMDCVLTGIFIIEGREGKGISLFCIVLFTLFFTIRLVSVFR